MKTLLHEIRYYRNQWAHSYEFDIDEVLRIYDTLY